MYFNLKKNMVIISEQMEKSLQRNENIQKKKMELQHWSKMAGMKKPLDGFNGRMEW